MIDWTKSLENLISSPCHERPFICDGFPHESAAIVIGENPATPLSKDWWSYWSADTGFDYGRFVRDYLQERNRIGKRISNTRRRLNRIRESGVSCVETNAFSNEAFHGAGVGKSNYEILNLLVKNMPNLRAIIAHGNVAATYLNAADIPANVRTFSLKHFRAERYDVIDQVCEEIKAIEAF